MPGDVFTSSMEVDYDNLVDGVPTAVCTVTVRVMVKDGPASLAKLIKAAGVVQ